jgi:hypothetical protein
MIPTPDATRPRPALTVSQAHRPGRTIFPVPLKLGLDLALAALFLATITSAFVDIHLHKWLGGIIVVVVAIHLVLHRRWIQAIGARFLGQMSALLRLKAVLDTCLLLVFLLLTTSGLIVSIIYSPRVTRFHIVCVYIFLGLALFHLALNWKWIASNVKRRSKIGQANSLKKEIYHESSKRNQ